MTGRHARVAEASRTDGYRPALDGLRAVAVAAVVLYHLGGHLPGGFLGVDTFFVLSGYLITGLLVKEHDGTGRINVGRFWVRRVRRLFPALVVVLIGVIVAQALSPDAASPHLRSDALTALFYVANWSFVAHGQSYFDQYAAASPLRHTWSLAIEEQFYLLWPLVVLCLLRVARRRRVLLAAVTVLGVIGSVALMAALYDPADPSRAYYGTDTRIFEIFVGALTALLLARPDVRDVVQRRAGHIALAGITTMTVAFLAMGDHSPVYYRGGALLFSLVVAATVAGVELGPRHGVRSWLSRPTPVALGKISYGVYLWHWPVVVFATPTWTGLHGLALQGFVVAVTLLGATASYHLVERPIRRHQRFAVAPRRLAIALPAVNMVIAIVIVTATSGAVLGRSTTAAATTPVTDVTVQVATPKGPTPAPVLGLVGDSVAAELVRVFAAESHRRSWTFTSAAYPGCPAVTTEHVGWDREPLAWQKDCETIAARHDKLLRQDPDVVVWFSGTENMPLRTGAGKVVMPGTSAHSAVLAKALESELGRLTRRGATVVFVLAPPRVHPVDGCAAHGSTCADVDRANASRSAVNAVFESVASRHPDKASVLRIDEVVCGGRDPCPKRVGGVVTRPDGTHFSLAFAQVVVRMIADRVAPMLAGEPDRRPR